MTAALPIGAGALAALGVVLLAQAAGRRRELLLLTLGLAGAALIYVLSSASRGGWRALLVDSVGLVAFSALALAGWRGAPALLALGWLLHAGWDLAAPTLIAATTMPFWYRWGCAGFDLVIAGYVIGRFGARGA